MSENTPIPEPEAPQPSAAFGSVDPQSVEGLFLAALAKTDTDQRRTFLDQSCRDADQRQRVEALLRAYDDAGSFLETPVLGNRVAAGGSRESARDGVPLDFLTPTTEPGYVGALGPYLILEVIGRGGMGIVLRGFDRKLNRIVAIKVLAPELAANPNARRRFVREARAAASVSHPHVVTIHAVDDEQLPPYLVMECVVGQSLQEKLDRTGPLRLTEVLRIGRQVADGLAAAHQQGLVHRDIKPANILLENGVERVKITDFGLARAVDDVAITRAGEVSGTPQYMSPEQARGEPVDRRSDLFSLGCVLYAMCTGGPPFRGDSLAAVIKRVTEEHPQPIGEMNPEVPPWLADVISRLLEKDPARRFQSASEVAEVLAGRLASVQQPAGPAPLPERQPPPPKRRLSLFVARMAVYGALGVIGSLGEIVGVWTPPVLFFAALLLTPLGWIAIWRGKRDGRRPWCELSYVEPAVAAVAFLLAVGVGFHAKQTAPLVSWGTPAAGVVGLLISAVVTLTLILLAGGRRSAPEEAPQRSPIPTAPAAPSRTRAERVLVWLAIVLLTMVVLVPGCLIGLGWLYTTLAQQKQIALKTTITARDVALSQQAAVEESQRKSLAGSELASEQGAPPVWHAGSRKPAADAVGATLPPGVRWEIVPPAISTAKDRVQLNVRLLSEGMLVALRRRSLFDNRLSPEEHLATSIGAADFAVQPGQYEVLVRDERFGWQYGNRGTIDVREDGLGTLTVERDLAASVRPAVDFNATVGSAAQFVSSASEERFQFLWNGQRHELTRWQSAAVHKLAEATAGGHPEVPDAEVVGSIREPWRHGATLAENFRSADGPVAAWGKLVVPGKKPGTYRLAPVPQATLTVDLRTPDMTVSVFFPQERDSRGRAIFLEGAKQHRLAVAPGKYRVQLVDMGVHWFDLSMGQPIPSRTQELTLDDGKVATFVGERHWQDYTVAKNSFQTTPVAESGARYVLYWFGRGASGPMGSGAGFGLSARQATFVACLFKGLADGKPDVAEEQLLKAASAKSMPDLFPGIDGKSPKQEWSSLFVPGDLPKTWRLNVPKPG